MKKLSNLELSELIYMASAMCDQIKIYSHVSDKMSKSVKNVVREYYTTLCNEQERRENEQDAKMDAGIAEAITRSHLNY